MNKTEKKLLFSLIASLILILLIPRNSDTSYQNTTTETTTSNSGIKQGPYKVTKVVDGDTLELEIGGTNTKIRLIGLNTPETVDPRKEVECFGKEASNKAKELLLDTQVYTESDESQQNMDKYGRLLRYVYTESGINVNKYMIEEGYGYEYTYNTPYKYAESFKAAQTSAEQNKKGLWADNACQ